MDEINEMVRAILDGLGLDVSFDPAVGMVIIETDKEDADGFKKQ